MSTPTPRTLAGIVVSAGKMMKTVKVRIAQQVFNTHIRKVPHLTPAPFSSPIFPSFPYPFPLAPRTPTYLYQPSLEPTYTTLHSTPTSPLTNPPPLTNAPNAQQYFPTSSTHLVHDPTSILREGDIVRIAAGWRVSRRKRHVVTEVVAAFGTPVEKRAPLEKRRGGEEEEEGERRIVGDGEGEGRSKGLVGLEELVREREERREEKRARREGRRRERVEMGVVGPGDGEGGKGR